MTRPTWWPEDRRGVSGRYVVTVDGDAYGFTSGSAARGFFARLECLTFKVAVFNDHGRGARGRGRVRRRALTEQRSSGNMSVADEVS